MERVGRSVRATGTGRRLMAVGGVAWLAAATVVMAAGFNNPADKNEFSWDVDPAATLYEAARSGLLGFDDCVSITTTDTFWSDPALPAPGEMLVYLQRTVEPAQGSWGQGSDGMERSTNCSCATWARSFGGPVDERMSSMDVTGDGGLVIGGAIRSFDVLGDQDGWALKADASGGTAWQKRIGGPGTDRIRGIREADDGTLVVAADTRAEGAIINWDLAMLRLADSGSFLGLREVKEVSEDRSLGTVPTPDGGQVVVGYTRSVSILHLDIIALRFDRNGNLVRQTVIGLEGDDRAWAVLHTPEDDGFVIVADSTSFGPGGEDIVILKLNRDLNILWQRGFRGAGFESPRSVVRTLDGGFLIVGLTESFGISRDAWLIKVDIDGNPVWEMAYGGDGGDSAEDAVLTADGGFLVVGQFGGGADIDAWMFKVDSTGALQWQRRHGGAATDVALHVEPTLAGGYYVAGETASFGAGGFDFWALKTDQAGLIDPLCTLTLDSDAISGATNAITGGTNLQAVSPGAIPSESGGGTLDTVATSAEQCATASCGNAP